jgi:Family of unknown function (DUF6267)
MQNKHLTHVEDLLVTEADALIPLQFLEDTFYFLCGYNPHNVILSTKWDGAPAFVCGIHPETKKFFVGTKSVFSKEEKVYYSILDITVDENISIGLRVKLIDLFSYLSPLNWDGVVQGDLLWSGNDGYYLYPHTMQFCPNILKYEILIDGFPGLGAVLHTSYEGETLKNSIVYLGAKIPKTNYSDHVHLFSPVILLPEKSFLDNTIKEFFLYELDILWKNSHYINECFGQYLGHFKCDSKFLDFFLRSVNYYIKNFETLPRINECNFLYFMREELDKHKGTLKTEKGKLAVEEQKQEYLNKIPYEVLRQIFLHYNHITFVKEVLIQKLDEAFCNIKITLPDRKNCGHEGYVISSYGSMCKLVNRNVFSKYNFNTPKEWK